MQLVHGHQFIYLVQVKIYLFLKVKSRYNRLSGYALKSLNYVKMISGCGIFIFRFANKKFDYCMSYVVIRRPQKCVNRFNLALKTSLYTSNKVFVVIFDVS